MENKFVSSQFYRENAKSVQYLLKNLWKEGTCALLHAPRQTDKTVRAIEIAADIARKGRAVVYVDVERRIDDHRNCLPALSNLYIYTPQYESPDDKTDFADLVINGIEEAIKVTKSKVFVIDTITRIAALSFGRNASAPYVMKRLVALQMRYNISILVIAHDASKTTDRALLAFADCELACSPTGSDSPQPRLPKYDFKPMCSMLDSAGSDGEDLREPKAPTGGRHELSSRP